MSKRPPSGETLRSMLQMGHFGTDHGPLAPADPLSRTTIHQVPIDQIDFYDRNPRRVRNPNYEEIKESIRASGVQQNPKITRRPGEARYMLAFGGNTRLAILRELLAETGDARFAAVDCDFVPWSSETAVLVGHLIENETRGELTFIDKARGVREARTLIEAERGQALSKRQLAEALRERGFRIDPPMLTRYDYTLDVLADAIPRALNAGIGRPQIGRLRQLDTAAQTVWHRRGLGTDEIYRAVFCEALAAVDGEDWDFEHLRRTVESALAQRAGIEGRLATLELGAELDDTQPLDEDSMADEPGGHSPQLTLPEPAGLALPAAQLPNPPGEARDASTQPVMPAPSVGTVDQREQKPVSATATSQSAPAIESPESTCVDDELRRARLALGEAGRRYAQLTQLERCIRAGDEAPSMGYGYLVIDFPDAFRLQEAGRSDAAKQALAWSFWTLAQCCDLFAFVERMILAGHSAISERERACAEYFGPQSGFVKAWCDEGSAQQIVDETVGNADAYGYSDYVDAASPDLWAADVALRQAFRNLRMLAARAGIDVWNEAATDGRPP
jgi:ParB family protein of integrating conjugative element (PFGI_1 class)